MTPKVLTSTISFQIIWWQLLLFVSQGEAVIGCLITSAYLLFHLAVTAKNRWRRELKFILIFGLAGWLLDGVFVVLGFQVFQTSPFAPLWLLFLWFNYMTSIHYSMPQVFTSLPLTLFIGFIFGPWTYLGCAKLNLVQFSSTLWICALQGVVWMLWLILYRRVVLKKIFWDAPAAHQLN